MKKVLTTALVLGALCGTANAKIYLGVDGGYTTIDMKKFEIDGVSKENSFSIGLNAGINYTINDQFFVGAEAHVRGGDLFNKKYYAFTTVSGEKKYDEDTITNPFGAKIYAGTIINKKIELFASVGAELIDFEMKYWDPVTSLGGGLYRWQEFEDSHSDVAMSFGFGVGYKISDNLNARLSYEHLNYEYHNKNYYFDAIKAPINTIRLGVNYLF